MQLERKTKKGQGFDLENKDNDNPDNLGETIINMDFKGI